jgi:hypothetical protein
MKKLKLTKKKYIFITVVAIIFILLTFIRMPVKTIKVDYESFEDKVEFKGIYLAQEFVLYQGIVNESKLLRKNGEKVAKGVLVTDSIRSSESGMIINHLDNFENKFSLDNIDNINEKEIEQVIEKQKQLPGIKVLNNSDWYIYALVGKTEGFKKGQSYKAMLGNRYYSVDISKVVNKSDNIFLLMKLKNDLNTTNLQRGLTGFIIKSRNKGFVLPKSAIVVYNGNQGVFVKNNDYAEFRKIKIMHENNDVFWVEPDTSSKKRLQQYDQVISKPNNIEEGTKVK